MISQSSAEGTIACCSRTGRTAARHIVGPLDGGARGLELEDPYRPLVPVVKIDRACLELHDQIDCVTWKGFCRGCNCRCCCPRNFEMASRGQTFCPLTKESTQHRLHIYAAAQPSRLARSQRLPRHIRSSFSAVRALYLYLVELTVSSERHWLDEDRCGGGSKEYGGFSWGPGASSRTA